MTKKVVAMAAVLALVAVDAQAQSPGKFSLELRGGAALPTKELGPSDLNTGMNLEMTANLQVLPHLALYGGWDYGRFTLKQNLGVYEDGDDTGYAFGARVFAPAIGKVTPWIRGGGVYDHIELEGNDSDQYVRADHVLGWEAGAGAAVALGSQWSLTPGVRYRSFSPELTELGGKADVRYVTIDIGISRTFGGKSVVAVRSAL